MKIAVLGAGYVGLVTGACLSQLGHDVHLFDPNKEKIDMLNEGIVPIHEPGLEEIIAPRNTNIRFHWLDPEAPKPADDFDAYYIAVGTPRGFNGNAEMSYVRDAAAWIRKTRKTGRRTMIVIKSTVPPGTARQVRAIVGDRDVTVLSNPEFLKEGSAIADFQKPDRVVVGGLTTIDDIARFMAIYENAGIPSEKFLIMSNESAELAKYASNGMLATRISFMNEMARIAHEADASIDDVRRAVAADSRIGPDFLKAGPGWGGSCFPKDLQALSAMSELQTPVVQGASITNRMQSNWIVDRILSIVGYPSAGIKVCIWGAAFKPDTDDVRCSPAFSIIRGLAGHRVPVTIHDPIAKLPEDFLLETHAGQDESVYTAAKGASLVVVLTDWEEYRSVDWKRLAGVMASPVIFDTRNFLSRPIVQESMRLVRL